MKHAGIRGNRILTEEKIQEYCEWLNSCEKSSRTIEKYRFHLGRLLKYADGKPISKDLVLLWKCDLRETLSPVTVNGAIAAVNGYFRYRGWGDCVLRLLKFSRNPFAQEDRELSRDEYARLITCAASSGNERLALLIETLCCCGIRISELAFITVEAMEKRMALVECKGRIRTVLIPKNLCAVLENYASRKGITHGKIFITRTGKALDRSNVWREMKALSEKAAVSRTKIFPHNLRHLFARTYYAVKKDLSKLADILGHRDVNTTRIYTMENGSEHRKQIENLGLFIKEYNGISLLL